MSYPIRTCFIKGKIIKQLCYYKIGVLVFEGNLLTFYNANSLKGKRANVCPDVYEGKVVFLSNSFDMVKMLDNEESYKLEFFDKFLVFKRVDGDTQLVLEGIRLYP